MIRYCLYLILFFTPAFILPACVQNEYVTDKPVAAGPNVLRVGITTNAPPMAYRNGGEITGLEADFARGLAQFTGRKLSFVELKWKDQIPALLAGKTDIIMSSMTITAARSYQIAFCNPYMISGQVCLVRLPEMYRFRNGFTDLLNPTVKIGTVYGTTGALLIQKNVATDGKKRFFNYESPEQGVQALRAKNIDAFVYDLPMNFYFAAENEINGLAPVTIPMTREQIAWGVRKGDNGLREDANAYLAAIKKDGRLKQMLIHRIPFFHNVFNR
jgi:polar amino acid transport system substrate-binding protein